MNGRKTFLNWLWFVFIYFAGDHVYCSQENKSSLGQTKLSFSHTVVFGKRIVLTLHNYCAIIVRVTVRTAPSYSRINIIFLTYSFSLKFGVGKTYQAWYLIGSDLKCSGWEIDRSYGPTQKNSNSWNSSRSFQTYHDISWPKPELCWLKNIGGSGVEIIICVFINFFNNCCDVSYHQASCWRIWISNNN